MLELLIANKNYSSWSLRPWVLMHTLGIPFQERLVPFVAPGDPNPFATFSPSGKVPCLRDRQDDREVAGGSPGGAGKTDGARTVWDSLAIIEYLAERHAGVWPADVDARAWARSASAEMHAGFGTLRQICTMNCGIRVRLHSQPPALLADIARIDTLWQQGLSRFGGPWLAGAAFSAVDAMYAPVAFRFQTYDVTISPAARAWVERMLALPAMQRWTTEALAEPWRDAAHDDEARAVGTWLQDLRQPI